MAVFYETIILNSLFSSLTAKYFSDNLGVPLTAPVHLTWLPVYNRSKNWTFWANSCVIACQIKNRIETTDLSFKEAN